MSTDPIFERRAVLLRAQTYLLGGRVYDSVPDDRVLERSDRGVIRPYAVVHWGIAYALPRGRSLAGEEEQPHVQPFAVQAYAPTSDAAQASAGAIRDLFVGWAPSPGADEITAPGGGTSRDRDTAGAPTIFTEAVSLEFGFNLGSNEGYVPSPGHAPGGETSVTIEQIVERYLLEHRLSYERHDFPIPVGQWSMVHALGRIPSVTTYSLDGERLLSDTAATDTGVVVTWANPTAGFVILN